jgi:hypothetical protein
MAISVKRATLIVIVYNMPHRLGLSIIFEKQCNIRFIKVSLKDSDHGVSQKVRLLYVFDIHRPIFYLLKRRLRKRVLLSSSDKNEGKGAYCVEFVGCWVYLLWRIMCIRRRFVGNGFSV